MNKQTSLLLSSIALACLSPAVGAATRDVEGTGMGALTNCPASTTVPTIYHFDKIVFVISGALTAVKQEDQVALNNLPRNAPLDVKLRDNPTRVAHLKSKVLSFLGASTGSENQNSITIMDVGYTAVLCPAGNPNPV